MGRKYENEQKKNRKDKMIIRVLFYYHEVLHFVAMAMNRQQSSPFLSAQQEKEFFQSVEHLWESVLIITA